MLLPATSSQLTYLPAAGSPASQLEQDPTNSPGLRGSWPQGRTWCWAAADSHGQPRTTGSGLAWLPGETHTGKGRMPPFSLPHLKYLLSTCCVSVRDQGSRVSSPSPRADPAGASGQVFVLFFFSKRTVQRTWVRLPEASGALGVACWGRREGACRVQCMQPSSAFLGS